MTERELIKDTLNLISQQKAEVKRLKDYMNFYREQMISYGKLTDRLLGRIREIREENKHLTTRVEEIEKAKSEAVREFADKLIKKSVWDDLGDTKIVYVYEIDKLLVNTVDGLSLVKGGAE